MTFGEARVVQWWVRLLGAIALLLVVFLVYRRLGAAGFIWDDESHLTQNPCIIGPLGLADIWTSTSAFYYPLVLTTFWVLHHFLGLNPLPYHILNVAFHAGSALLLWRVLVQLRVRGAWLGAAIWALHPVLVQSVAWVTEMKNTQSAFFYLLAISCFLQSRERKRNFIFYWLTLLFFFAAITSKPSTVMLPLVLGLCLWWREGGIKQRDLRLLLPFVLTSLLASGWTIWEQKFHSHAIGADWVQTPLQRILISADAIWFYLIKLTWPYPLIFIYARWNVDPSQRFAWIPLVALLITAAVLLITRNSRLRPVAFAFAYFVITLFPVLDFFDVYFFRYSFVSDHFQYLASMGPLALAGAGIATAAEEIGVHRLAIQTASTLVILSILGVLSFHQSAKYHDVVTLYQTTLAQNPKCWMAEYNLGLALKDQKQLDQAIAHYRRALNIRPDYVEAHYNLGGAYIDKGEFDEALAEYRRAIQIRPDEADTHNNYGSALRELKQFDQAEIEYKRALSLRPKYLDARLNLGSLLLQRGRTAEAITNLETARRLQPTDAATHVTLALALMKNGQGSQAAAEFNRALQLAPDRVNALTSFAWLLATAADDSVRDGKRAVQLAERANALAGNNDLTVLHTLAAAYAEARRFEEALQTAHRAMKLASQADNNAVYNAIRDELPLYELGLPYHETAKTP
jgi:tetratricopeptide (TPR) repeat protein